MFARNYVNNASNLIAICLFITFWHLGSVNGAPSLSSVELPFCNEVLDADSSVSCDVDRIQQGSSPSHFYGVYCITNDPSRETLVDDDAEACDIDSHHGLRIKLRRITRISHILLEESAFVPRFTNVSLAIGRASYDCKHSRVGAHHGRVIVSNRSFAKFECHHVSLGVQKTPEANVILINSFVARTLNLATLRSNGSLGWVLLKDGIYVIAEHFGTFGSDWNETKGTHARPEKSQENEKDLPKECPPLKSYLGMVENYKNYQLVLDGSINELMLRKPCRDGYKFVGNISDITRCINGTWQGSGFPKCEAIRTKTPPVVYHARWSYVHDDAFHEIVYSCDDGYYLTGATGTATYDYEKDNWTDVPECHQRDDLAHQQSVQDSKINAGIIIGVIISAVIAVIVGASVFYFFCYKKTCRKPDNSHQTPSTGKRTPTEASYTKLNINAGRL